MTRPGRPARGEPRRGRDAGALVVVSTPIGNLGDMTDRARDVLRRADVIAAEDTRRTGALLAHLSIPVAGRLRAVHAHNEQASGAWVVEAVLAGAEVAYVVDAGTPGVSDPGARLVAACAASGAVVTATPGASALLAALALSGFPADRFVFEGFLPRRGRERGERIRALAGEPRTTVLFEAPRRVAATLRDLAAACDGARLLLVARELTKLHEDVWRGTVAEAVGPTGPGADGAAPRGEHVVVLGPAAPVPPEVDDDTVRNALRVELGAGASVRDAAGTVSSALGVARRRAYALALNVREGAGRSGAASRPTPHTPRRSAGR